ncbi:MAG: ABC transporter permease [Rhodococcus sp. (in: high G+C Gram-positive bacteria)]
MFRYLIRRLLAVIPLLLIVAVMAFGLIYLVPGDPAVAGAGENATPERVEEVRAELGLDGSFIEQFGSWAADLLQGDLGTSLFSDIPVWDQIEARLPATMSLVVFGLVLAVLVGIPLGLIAGLRQGSWVDRVLTVLATAGIAIPAFWLATLLILFFAVDRHLLPATGYIPFGESPWEWFRHMLLPGLAIGAASAAEVARQTRSGVVSIVGQDYIRTSRAMGLSRRSIAGKHVLKNAGVPIVTVVGLQVGRIIGAGLVVEQMFAIPGLGQLTVAAVQSRDIPTIQGVVLVIASIVLFTNLLVDVSYAFFSPKLRSS